MWEFVRRLLLHEDGDHIGIDVPVLVYELWNANNVNATGSAGNGANEIADNARATLATPQ